MKPNRIPATIDGIPAILKRASTPGYWHAWAACPADGPMLQTSRGAIPTALWPGMTASEAAHYANDPADAAAINGCPDSSD